MAEPVDPNVARAERAANRGAHNAPADPAANEDATESESEHDAEEEAQGDDEAAQPHADRRVVFSAPRNIVQLPKFSGKPAESKNVNFFLEKLDAFFEFHGYTLPRHILPTLYSCFPDDSIALRWYSNARSNGEITSYRTFKRAFKSHFEMPVADRIDLYAQFSNLRQSHESVSSYHSKFIKLMSDLEAVGAVFREPDRVTAFVRGLRSLVKERVNVDLIRDFDAMTLEKVFSLAVMYDSVLATKEPTNPRPPPGLIAMGASTQRAGLCAFCKQPGHYFNDCPKVLAKKKAGTWEERGSK